MATYKCPTCGSTLHVETSKEGTSFFIPVDVEVIDELAEKLAKAIEESRLLRWELEHLKERRGRWPDAKGIEEAK